MSFCVSVCQSVLKPDLFAHQKTATKTPGIKESQSLRLFCDLVSLWQYLITKVGMPELINLQVRNRWTSFRISNYQPDF